MSLANAGTLWSPKEDAQLEQEVKAYLPIVKIAEVHKRNINAINARISRKIQEGKIDKEMAQKYGLPPPEMIEKKYTIYVISCEDENIPLRGLELFERGVTTPPDANANKTKYYVGRTENLSQRLEQHKTGENASAFTSKYKYKDIIETFVGEKYDEDKTVLKYMEVYGIDNVRGGSYSNLELSFDQYLFIQRQINHGNSMCLACGKSGHFIRECHTEICYRCGGVGHTYTTCTAIEHTMNGKLDGCTRCGRPDHWAFRCNRSKDVFGRPLEQSNCAVM